MSPALLGRMIATMMLNSSDEDILILLGLATGASWVCYFRALKIGEAAQIAPIDKLSAALVAGFGMIVLGERLAPANWLGVALIAVGAILIAYKA